MSRTFLRPFSALYETMARWRAQAYERGRLWSERLSVPVISIGNITVGGTGKTPATIALARWIRRELRLEVTILSRGYKRRRPRKIRLVSPDDPVDGVGDEPLLMARSLPQVPVIVGKRRIEAARWALKRFPTDLFLLDDGFQHLRLKRDLDIVLIDAVSLFGNERLLPEGPLREPISALRRADVLCLTRTDAVENLDSIKDRLHSIVPSRPILFSSHRPTDVWDLKTGAVTDLPSLTGRKAIAVCGIAQPNRFLETVGGLGVHVLEEIIYPDHYRYRQRDWDRILKEGVRRGAEIVLTTEKDAMRMRGFSSEIPVSVVRVEWVVTEGWSLLERRIRALFPHSSPLE